MPAGPKEVPEGVGPGTPDSPTHRAGFVGRNRHSRPNSTCGGKRDRTGL
jgi:hypothetical protein